MHTETRSCVPPTHAGSAGTSFTEWALGAIDSSAHAASGAKVISRLATGPPGDQEWARPEGMMSVYQQITAPDRLWSRPEVLASPSPVPREPGLYGWFFDPVIPGVPIDDTTLHRGRRLLYAGISPKAPPKNGKPPSKQQLRQRICDHMRGNAQASTLRLTLGCLLANELGIELRRVGSGKRMTFGPGGEAKLSKWLDRHAAVAWVVHPRPWEAETEAIHRLSLPLNLQQNQQHRFHSRLTEVRKDAKSRARNLPTI